MIIVRFGLVSRTCHTMRIVCLAWFHAHVGVRVKIRSFWCKKTVFVAAHKPRRVAQSVGHLTRKSEILGSIPGLATHTFVSPSADSRGAAVSYWRKYVHEVLVDRLGGQSLPRKSVVSLPHLLHGFRNRHFNKISLDNILYFHN